MKNAKSLNRLDPCVSLIRQIINYCKRISFYSPIRDIINISRKLLLIVFCGITDRISDTSDKLHPMVVLRKGGQFDTISVSLITQLNREFTREEINKVVFVVNSKEKFRKEYTPVQTYLENDFGHPYTVVEKDTLGFVEKFKKCNAIILRTKGNLWEYRYIADRKDKLLVHIYHGPITKAQGNLTTSSIKKQRSKDSTTINPYPYGRISRFDRLDVKSVASEVKRHFHSAGEARAPGVFRKWGYPRFDRICELKENPSLERAIPRETEQILFEDNSSVKILYAPTHYGGANVHPFRLPDFDFDKFTQLLEEHDITIYMRMHYSEEENENYQRFVQHDRIKYAGYSFSPSSVEILDQFDALITDYSSIYVEFLRFDRPILFIDSERKHFDKNRGIAFEYDTFFPGPKIKNFEEFLTEIENITIGVDSYEEERNNVESVLLPEQNYEFLRNLYIHWERKVDACSK